MTEGRGPTAVIDGRLDERLVERMLESAAAGPPAERVRDAVEAVIDVAESDPSGARKALWSLRGDCVSLERLEAGLRMSPERATLAIGAAIQIASAELGSASPDLRSRTDELLCWLEGAW
jgi:hypothetical protein